MSTPTRTKATKANPLYAGPQSTWPGGTKDPNPKTRAKPRAKSAAKPGKPTFKTSVVVTQSLKVLQANVVAADNKSTLYKWLYGHKLLILRNGAKQVPAGALKQATEDIGRSEVTRRMWLAQALPTREAFDKRTNGSREIVILPGGLASVRRDVPGFQRLIAELKAEAKGEQPGKIQGSGVGKLGAGSVKKVSPSKQVERADKAMRDASVALAGLLALPLAERVFPGYDVDQTRAILLALADSIQRMAADLGKAKPRAVDLSTPVLSPAVPVAA